MKEWIRRLRIFKRLRELEEMQRLTLGAEQDRFDVALSRDGALALGMDAMGEDVAKAFARFVVCPNCGSVLDSRSPRVSKYETAEAKILCCVGCRAFIKGTFVRTMKPEERKTA